MLMRDAMFVYRPRISSQQVGVVKHAHSEYAVECEFLLESGMNLNESPLRLPPKVRALVTPYHYRKMTVDSAKQTVECINPQRVFPSRAGAAGDLLDLVTLCRVAPCCSLTSS